MSEKFWKTINYHEHNHTRLGQYLVVLFRKIARTLVQNDIESLHRSPIPPSAALVGMEHVMITAVGRHMREQQHLHATGASTISPEPPREFVRGMSSTSRDATRRSGDAPCSRSHFTKCPLRVVFWHLPRCVSVLVFAFHGSRKESFETGWFSPSYVYPWPSPC